MAYGISCAAHVAAFVAAAGLGWRPPSLVNGGEDHTQPMLVDIVPATFVPMALGSAEKGASGVPAPSESPPAAVRARRRPSPRPKKPILTGMAPVTTAQAVHAEERAPTPPPAEAPAEARQETGTTSTPAQAPAPVTGNAAGVTPGAGLGGRGAGGGGGRGGEGRASRPPLVPNSIATYLRVEQTFPSLPDKLNRRGAVYLAEAEICVSSMGKVDGVTITRRAAPELDDALVRSIRHWRYRPRMIDGAASPFCHLMRFDYRRE